MSDSDLDDSATIGSTVVETVSTGAGSEPDAGLQALLMQIGIDPSSDIESCVEDRGAATSASGVSAGSPELMLAILSCAPAESARSFGESDTPPEGITEDQSTCALEEMFRYLGGLSVEEGVAAIEASDVPEDVRADLTPIVVDNCDMTADQVNLLLDS